jgi:hypothetical protein
MAEVRRRRKRTVESLQAEIDECGNEYAVRRSNLEDLLEAAKHREDGSYDEWVETEAEREKAERAERRHTKRHMQRHSYRETGDDDELDDGEGNGDDTDQERLQPPHRAAAKSKRLPPGIHVGLAGAEEVNRLDSKGKKSYSKQDKGNNRFTPAASGGQVSKGAKSSPAIKTKADHPTNDQGMKRRPDREDRTFLMVPSQLLRRRDLSLGAKCVYAYLENIKRMAIEQAKKTRSQRKVIVAPRQSIMAEYFGVTRQTIGNQLNELEQAEMITRKRRGHGQSTMYTIL